MKIRAQILHIGSIFLFSLGFNLVLYSGALSQSNRPASGESRQESFKPVYDEKSTRMISERLVKLISQKACISRLKLGISNNTALTASRTEVLQSYPTLASSIPPISMQSIESQYRQTCKPLFQREIVLKLPDELIPKPVKLDDFADPTACRVDAYWLNKLMTTSRLYLENRQCLFDVRR